MPLARGQGVSFPRISVTPHIVAFWSTGMNYFDSRDEEDAGLVAGAEGLESGAQGAHDPRTPLDRTIDRIGMGACHFPPFPPPAMCAQCRVAEHVG